MSGFTEGMKRMYKDLHTVLERWHVVITFNDKPRLYWWKRWPYYIIGNDSLHLSVSWKCYFKLFLYNFFFLCFSCRPSSLAVCSCSRCYWNSLHCYGVYICVYFHTGTHIFCLCDFSRQVDTHLFVCIPFHSNSYVCMSSQDETNQMSSFKSLKIKIKI